MKVSEVTQKLGLKVITLPSPDREIHGGYVGDLLSWVMGRAGEDNAWVTIMSNINIVAVASLADVSCVILAEGVTIDNEVIETAESKGVNILASDLPAFDICVSIADIIK